MKLFEITIAGRLFKVTREPNDCNEFCQTYSVSGREVPVQDYLQQVAEAVNTAIVSLPRGMGARYAELLFVHRGNR